MTPEEKNHIGKQVEATVEDRMKISVKNLAEKERAAIDALEHAIAALRDAKMNATADMIANRYPRFVARGRS